MGARCAGTSGNVPCEPGMWGCGGMCCASQVCGDVLWEPGVQERVPDICVSQTPSRL